MGDGITVERVDHIGIRVADLDRSLKFYELLGFEETSRAVGDPVVIIRNACDVELNLVVNGAPEEDGTNILMDVATKYAGLTHLALRVPSITGAIRTLKQNDIPITQGPVMFGRDGHVSVFVRDPDRNVIEFRGRAEDHGSIEGLEFYQNQN